ncbi:RHS repeat-associated core domain-containing protein, partial [Serratia marcescens]
RSADIYWYHTDLNSAPLEVTDAAGNLCWSGQYDTFGKLQGQTVAGAAKRQGAQYQQPLRYAGQYQDDESGLHYNLFRYYEPEVGRFTTQDPIGLEGGLNLYQYAPNPLMWVDPYGLSCSPSTKLNRKFRALEKAQKTAVNTRHLPDGRIRYYDKEALARTQGPTRGRSHVTEWDPKTGNVRSWEETYNHAGEVNRVHPKMKNGEVLNLPHYPPTKADIDAGIATPSGKATGIGW